MLIKQCEVVYDVAFVHNISYERCPSRRGSLRLRINVATVQTEPNSQRCRPNLLELAVSTTEHEGVLESNLLGRAKRPMHPTASMFIRRINRASPVRTCELRHLLGRLPILNLRIVQTRQCEQQRILDQGDVVVGRIREHVLVELTLIQVARRTQTLSAESIH